MVKGVEEERKHLKTTLSKIQEIIDDTELKIQASSRIYENNPALLSKILLPLRQKLELLKRITNRPYFARIDFKNEEDKIVEECYISKCGLYDNNNEIVTVDWRAPISSVYYDCNLGKTKYFVTKGTIEGELLLKRRYDIEKKTLLGFQDVDTVSNDEILKPYLGVSADKRLKNIVATIQTEQNAIIREGIYKNLIIQGVAGSGKTTVALHRIAYLVYNNIKNNNSSQYLVVGPNKFFLNYISGVLPDLEVNNVSQYTYDEIAKELLNEDFTLIYEDDESLIARDDYSKSVFSKFRVSMEFKELLDKFIIEYDNMMVPSSDFSINGYSIIKRDIIGNIYRDITNDAIKSYDVLSNKVERSYPLIGKYVEEHYENIISNVYRQYNIKVEDKSNSEAEVERRKIVYIEKELRNRCSQSIKKYFLNSKTNIIKLYGSFLENIDKYTGVNDTDISAYKKIVIKNIKLKRIEFEDLGAIIYLYYRIFGSSNCSKYRHVVVDEAQDLGEFNFLALKKLMSKSTFSIFGDLAQSIYKNRGIDNWQKVVTATFNGDCDIRYLNKSYRTTIEIMESANNVTRHIGFPVAEPVIRHGLDVQYTKTDNNITECLIKKINEYLEKGYSSIAIISKGLEESKKIHEELSKKDIFTNNIGGDEKEYKGGMCTITSSLVKGMEFDAAIITDASESKFDSEKLIDMKLLYVSMTRPLHELSVMYCENLTMPLQMDLQKSKKKIKKKHI